MHEAELASDAGDAGPPGSIPVSWTSAGGAAPEGAAPGGAAPGGVPPGGVPPGGTATGGVAPGIVAACCVTLMGGACPPGTPGTVVVCVADDAGQCSTRGAKKSRMEPLGAGFCMTGRMVGVQAQEDAEPGAGVVDDGARADWASARRALAFAFRRPS